LNIKKDLQSACAVLLLLILSSCAGVEIPNTKEATVAGVIQAGMDIAETNTGKIHQLTMVEAFDFLEPQNERYCIPVPGFNVCAESPTEGEVVHLPARAGAICRSDEDFTAQKNALEKACALLRDRCTADMKEALDRNAGNAQSLLLNAKKKKEDHSASVDLYLMEREDGPSQSEREVF